MCNNDRFPAGVMNAADYYGLDELRRSCVGFVQCCINVDTVCALLASAERYIQYKCTKSLVQKVQQWFSYLCAIIPFVDRICYLYRFWNLSTSMEMKVIESVDLKFKLDSNFLFSVTVLNLGSFTLLPQHVVRLVLCRDELKADEFTKFQVLLSIFNVLKILN